MTEELENNIIEITDDETGTVIQCELYDIIEFGGRQYALLLETDAEDDPEVVLMRYSEVGEESYFETIEDDDEFEQVSNYIESLDTEDEEVAE
jgi:uncharacterized protein YrzB (UPF0473 family)